MPEQLNQLKSDAIVSLDRFLTAVVELLIRPPLATVAQPAQKEALDFLKGLMIQVLGKDLHLQVPTQDAGWRTIHRFYEYCNRSYPRWASKQTFYHRMNASLTYLLMCNVAEKRPINRHLRKGRAKYEFRVNPNHPDIKKTVENGRVGFV